LLIDHVKVATAAAQDGKVLAVNQRYLDLFGLEPRHILGRSILTVVAPEDREVIRDRAARRVSTRLAPARYSFTGLRRGGPRLVVEVVTGEALSLFGRPTIVSTFRECPGPTVAVAPVLDQDRFMSDVFASIQDGVSVLSMDSVIVRVNPTMERWYPHAMPLVGQKCYVAYHGASAPCTVCPCRTAMATGTASREVVPLTGPNQRVVGWLELFAFPLFEERGGRMRGVIEYVRDITGRRQVEAKLERQNLELQRANRKLQRLHRAKDEFVAMVSHELRTPLVTGLGYVDLVLEGAYGAVPEGMAARMRIAQRSLRRLSNLIDGMLGYRRLMESDLPTLNPVDLRTVLAECVAEFLVRTGKPARLMKLAIKPDVSPVLADASMLRRVIANLLDNAAHHAGPEARIRLTAERGSAGKVRVAVADDGCGLPRGVGRRVFQPFVKGAGSSAGSGLGLAIVETILKAHDTTPLLESEEGHGTRVAFELAIASPAGTPAPGDAGG
jgi:PAS domain S-box-containing protein